MQGLENEMAGPDARRGQIRPSQAKACGPMTSPPPGAARRADLPPPHKISRRVAPFE